MECADYHMPPYPRRRCHIFFRYVGFWWTYLAVANRRFEPYGFWPNYLVASAVQFGHTCWSLRRAMHTRNFVSNDRRRLYDKGAAQVAGLSILLATAGWLMLLYVAPG